MLSILISPLLHIQMAALLSKTKNLRLQKDQFWTTSTSFHRCKDTRFSSVLLCVDCSVCGIIIATAAPSYVLAGSLALYSMFALQLFHGYVDCMQVTVSSWHCTLWVCHLSIYALPAFSPKVPHRDGAPYSELIPKCQPLGGFSCPVVPQLATLPTPSLKALTFTRHHGAARGGVTFAIFSLPGGKRVRWPLVWGNKATRVEMVIKTCKHISTAAKRLHPDAFALLCWSNF